ncbi:MAG: transcription antitermination factor NusB [Clostridia bacterium]
MRRDAREVTFKLIFEYLFKNEKNVELLVELTNSSDFRISEDDLTLINEEYDGVVEKLPELKEAVAKYAVGYSLDRIYKTDLALLLLAMYEIKYCPDIPNVVSVNEALELSKKYSSEKSTSFINGLLANFLKGLGITDVVVKEVE